jgi:hypothetical protein
MTLRELGKTASKRQKAHTVAHCRNRKVHGFAHVHIKILPFWDNTNVLWTLEKYESLPQVAVDRKQPFWKFCLVSCSQINETNFMLYIKNIIFENILDYVLFDFWLLNVVKKSIILPSRENEIHSLP